MKLSKIHCNNVLSFEKLELALNTKEGITYIVGPNNSGKTNIVRIVKYVLQLLEDRNIPPLQDICRNGDTKQGFSIGLEFKLEDFEMDKIEEYILMLGEVDYITTLDDRSRAGGINTIPEDSEKQPTRDDYNRLHTEIWTRDYVKKIINIGLGGKLTT